MNVTSGMAILHDRVVVMIQPDSDAKEKHLEICLTPFWQGAEQSFIPATLDLNKTCSFCQRIVENRQNHCQGHLSPWGSKNVQKICHCQGAAWRWQELQGPKRPNAIRGLLEISPSRCQLWENCTADSRPGMWADWDETRQLHTVYVCYWVPGVMSRGRMSLRGQSLSTWKSILRPWSCGSLGFLMCARWNDEKCLRSDDPAVYEVDDWWGGRILRLLIEVPRSTSYTPVTPFQKKKAVKRPSKKPYC